MGVATTRQVSGTPSTTISGTTRAIDTARSTSGGSTAAAGAASRGKYTFVTS